MPIKVAGGARMSNVDFYFTDDLSLGFTQLDFTSTNAVVLTNGVLQSDFPVSGVNAGFWRVVERP